MPPCAFLIFPLCLPLQEKTWELIKQSPFVVGKDWKKSNREAAECLIEYTAVEISNAALVIFHSVHE